MAFSGISFKLVPNSLSFTLVVVFEGSEKVNVLWYTIFFLIASGLMKPPP